MPAPKITGMTMSCKECPHSGYYSGGRHECSKTGEVIYDLSVVAPFCPLPNFPAAMIANMETTIRDLRKPYEFPLSVTILTYIATKLKTLRDAQSGVEIHLKDGTSIRLTWDSITQIDALSWMIYFVADNHKEYRLSPDSRPPRLQVKDDRTIPGIEGPFWKDVELA